MLAINNIQQIGAKLVRDYGLSKLGVFGSVARGEQTEDSDLDIYAEFTNPESETMCERYFGLIERLKSTFGCEVQVVTPAMLRNPVFKRSLERDLILIHG